MLVTTEIVRDVLCNEIIQLSQYDMDQRARKHVSNIASILMSDDFQQVCDPDEVWLLELKKFCRAERSKQVCPSHRNPVGFSSQPS